MHIEEETGLFWLGSQEGWSGDGHGTWVEEVGGSEGEGEKAGVCFPPCSLPQPLLIPLAGSLISLSEPNPPPFTYSVAGAGWMGEEHRLCLNPKP